MKIMLLAAAGALAVAAAVAPAAAENGGFGGRSSSHRFVGQQPFSCFGNGASTIVLGGRNGTSNERGDMRRACDSSVLMEWYGGEWALYNNRAWESDSYNDWWHDRPDRAYPAWMRRNQDCQRMWFAGDTLRC